MPLLTIIIVIIVVGVLLYIINQYIPMQPGIKKLLNIVVIVVLIIWLLKVFGFWGYLNNVKI